APLLVQDGEDLRLGVVLLGESGGGGEDGHVASSGVFAAGPGGGPAALVGPPRYRDRTGESSPPPLLMQAVPLAAPARPGDRASHGPKPPLRPPTRTRSQGRSNAGQKNAPCAPHRACTARGRDPRLL